MHIKSASETIQIRLREWTRQLLLAQPDRQFELVLVLSFGILSVTLLCAPIDLLRQVSLVSLVVTTLIAIGYVYAPHKKIVWITVFWALWQMQATVGTYLQGGIWSPYLGYYFICSMSILITVGWRWSLTTMGFTTFMIAGVAALDFKSLIPPSRLPNTEWLWPTVSSGMLIVTLGALPILAYGGRVRRIRQLNEDSERLRSAQAKLREHQIQQQQFVESVSHELRTPMNAIMGFLQSIDHSQIRSPEEREHIELMESHSRVLLNRINALLDFSQLHANQLVLQIAPFSLTELLQAVIQRHKDAAEAKGLQWQASIDSNLPSWTSGDAQRIEQVLDIVLGNAQRYTEFGQVRLSAEYTDQGHVRWVVSDTGCGMTEPNIQVLFSHLANHSERKNRAHGGTGIGLSTAQALLRLMQGSIQIKSNPKSGTQVTIEIPLAAQDRPTASASQASAIDPNVTGTVLIVDDSQTNRLITHHLLQKHLPMIHILEAACGEDAIAMVAEHQPHVVLMDLRLPGISGIDTAAAILRRPQGIRTQIFGLTGDPSQSVRREALATGMRGVFIKPFDATQLATSVSNALRDIAHSHPTHPTT